MSKVYASRTLRNDYTVHYNEWINTEDSDNQKIIPYGAENDHPEKLRLIQEKSLQHSNIIGVAANLIGGQPSFKMRDKNTPSNADQTVMKELRKKYDRWKIFKYHPLIAYSIYAYGAAPMICEWTTGATPSDNGFRMSWRRFEQFRLGKRINTFFGDISEHHYYSYYWHKIKRNYALDGYQIKSPKSYFASKKMKDSWVLKIPAFNEGMEITESKRGMFSYLIGMPQKSNFYYPKPFFESEVFWNKVNEELELSGLSRNTVKRGLRSDFIINIYRSIYNDAFAAQNGGKVQSIMNEDQLHIEEEYLGWQNAGTVKINYKGIGQDGNAARSEGEIEIIPIPNNNNFEEIEKREASISKHIAEAHSFGVPQLKGSTSDKMAFSNMAEFLSFSTEMYINTVIKPHCNPIENFYNNVVNKFNNCQEVETFIGITPPIIRALIKTFMNDLTKNERREMVFNKEPLTEEQKQEVEGINEESLNKITNQVYEKLNAKSL